MLHLPAYSLIEGALGATSRRAAAIVQKAGGELTIDASSSSLLDRFGLERFRALAGELRPAVLFGADRPRGRWRRTWPGGSVTRDGGPGGDVAENDVLLVTPHRDARNELIVPPGHELIVVQARQSGAIRHPETVTGPNSPT